MIVRQSTYDKARRQRDEAESSLFVLQLKYSALADKYTELIAEWNALVKKINARGGQEFLEGNVESKPQFTEEEIKKLLQLCHPDKHGGKQMAVDMTTKLLQLRG